MVVITNSGRGYEALNDVAIWAFGHYLQVPAPPAWDRFIAWVRANLAG
ncbi:MAG: hypothetical protein M3008_13505 [Chloroflexota bacterium]|nr:hypothetical protein [Chloroflexota bacterium]